MKPDPANDNPKPCQICGKPSAEKYRPFCSARCADVDLHRWLGGRYAIPAVETDEPDDETILPDDGNASGDD
ncbi:DNA gyrase inhibitor YacG [Oleomonas cavernae]|uniref:DNA gyrase inhibitor YacG n=1 Tax=Oleomonas cavernae TaxID=2320859 RepID=A0A418WGH0_9PROT|nr:DNA gyrase inhibitor YacG [Oleomonas cavernae]RJF89144.1 DNA gyrase inhibitor YacG [Oleomonas cavernae]